MRVQTYAVPWADGGSGEVGFEVTANCDGKACGFLTVGVEDGYWVVQMTEVSPTFRRQGVMTKMYEHTARYACEYRGRLASRYRITGSKATDFWDKQVAKGRATKRGDLYILNDCPPPSSLAGFRRKRRRP